MEGTNCLVERHRTGRAQVALNFGGGGWRHPVIRRETESETHWREFSLARDTAPNPVTLQDAVGVQCLEILGQRFSRRSASADRAVHTARAGSSIARVLVSQTCAEWRECRAA